MIDMRRQSSVACTFAIACLGIIATSGVLLAVSNFLQREPSLEHGGTRARIGLSANHATININGSAALAAFPDKTGAGIEGNPYIIEDLVIDAGGSGSAICISNTDAHLTI